MGSRYELVQCPYDKSHMVQAGRLQHHLIKCRKNHPDLEFATCPFNACHQFLRTELQSHLSRCPDRVWLNEEIHHWSATEPGRIKSGNLTIPDFDVESPKCVEDWDSEENMVTGGEVSSYHTHIYHPPQPLRIDTQTDTDTTDQESLPPQPRVFHTAVVSNMKKTQDNNGYGLRLPRHLPRALEQLRNARPVPIPPQEGQQGSQTQNPHRYDSNEQNNLNELSKGQSPNNPSSQGPILKVQSSQRQSLKGECHKGHTSQGESSKDQRYQEKCPTTQSSNENIPHAHGPKGQNLETQSMKGQISAAPPIKLAGLGRGLLRPMNVTKVKKPSFLANSPPRPSPQDVAGDRECQTTCRVLPTQTTSEPESCTSDQEVRHPTPRGVPNSDLAQANQPTGRGRGRGILGLSFCARKNTEADPGVGNRAVSPSLPIFSHTTDEPSSSTNATGKPRFVIPKVGVYDSPR